MWCPRLCNTLRPLPRRCFFAADKLQGRPVWPTNDAMVDTKVASASNPRRAAHSRTSPSVGHAPIAFRTALHRVPSVSLPSQHGSQTRLGNCSKCLSQRFSDGITFPGNPLSNLNPKTSGKMDPWSVFPKENSSIRAYGVQEQTHESSSQGNEPMLFALRLYKKD